MKNERIEIIKKYIYENIKILEDRKAEKEDKKIARMLIREEVEALSKSFLHTIITGTTPEVLAFRKDMQEIAGMLRAYLSKLDYKQNKFDNEIYQVYNDILFII